MADKHVQAAITNVEGGAMVIETLRCPINPLIWQQKLLYQ